MMRFGLILLTWLFFGFSFAIAQTTQNFSGNGVLVVDQDILFSDSDFGRKVRAGIDGASEQLSAENRKIEAELIAEEQALTEQRPTLSPEEFRALADDFDERVQRIRAEQEAKRDVLSSSLDDARRSYFQAIVPILAEILREEGAVVILNKRDVLLSVTLIDVTERAISRINDRLIHEQPVTETETPSDQ